jgi:hypothetical protein
MRIYQVLATISGTNDKPEVHQERIIADNWQETMEMLARICRDTGCVIREMRITETNDQPLDYKTIRHEG